MDNFVLADVELLIMLSPPAPFPFDPKSPLPLTRADKDEGPRAERSLGVDQHAVTPLRGTKDNIGEVSMSIYLPRQAIALIIVDLNIGSM